MIKLLIFDFDGTLADTRELIVETNLRSMRALGLPEKEEGSICATIGLPLVDGFLKMYPDISADIIPEWVRTYRELFEQLKGQFVPGLFPHVKETLSNLQERGFTLTVASSRKTSSLKEFLENMGLAPFFSYVLGVDDVAHAKPHPEPVLKTLKDLSFAPDEAMVIGDMPVDIQMGLGAGVWTCGVSYGNADRQQLLDAGAHYVIDDFAELKAVGWAPATSK